MQSFMGMRIQGLLPMLQIQLADRLGEEVSGFVQEQDLAAIATNPDVLNKVFLAIEHNLSDTLENKIASKSKVLDFLMGDRIQKEVRDFVMEEVREKLPSIISTYVTQTQSKVKVDEMVTSYLKHMPPSFWQELLEKHAAKLKHRIGILGGLMGLTIALILLAAQNILHVIF